MAEAVVDSNAVVAVAKMATVTSIEDRTMDSSANIMDHSKLSVITAGPMAYAAILAPHVTHQWKAISTVLPLRSKWVAETRTSDGVGA